MSTRKLWGWGPPIETLQDALSTLIGSSNDGPDRLKWAYELVRYNMLEFDSNVGYSVVRPSDFANILESDDLNVMSEERVFQMVERFLDNSDYYGSSSMTHEKKDIAMGQIMASVRTPTMIPHEILDIVEFRCRGFLKCREYMKEAIRWHIVPEERDLMKKSPRIKPRNPDIKIIAVGSRDKKTCNIIEHYTANTKTWIELRDIKIDRTHCAICICDCRVMICGGLTDDGPSDRVQIYDMVLGNMVEQDDKLVEARFNAAIITLGEYFNSYVFLVGGRGKDGLLKTVEKWDPDNREWEKCASMANAREDHGITQWRHRILVAGGRRGNKCLNSMEVYRPCKNRWIKRRPMNFKRPFCRLVTTVDFVFALGGYIEGTGELGEFTLEKYSYRKDKWTQLAKLDFCTGFIGAIAYGNRIYVNSGINDDGKCKAAEYVDDDDKWIESKPINVPRNGTNLIVVPFFMHRMITVQKERP